MENTKTYTLARFLDGEISAAQYLRFRDYQEDGHAGVVISTPGQEDEYVVAERCRLCDRPIAIGELCGACAEGNDPFFTSKYTEHRTCNHSPGFGPWSSH